MGDYTFHKKYPLYYELVSLYEINNLLKDTAELQASSMEITQFVVSIAEKR